MVIICVQMCKCYYGATIYFDGLAVYNTAAKFRWLLYSSRETILYTLSVDCTIGYLARADPRGAMGAMPFPKMLKSPFGLLPLF